MRCSHVHMPWWPVRTARTARAAPSWFTQTVSRHKQRHKQDERALEVMQAADSGRNKCRADFVYKSGGEVFWL